MFTGLIEEVGRIRSVDATGDGHRIVIGAPEILRDVQIGDSIAVDGVCVTAVARDDETVAVDVIDTTLARTTLGERTIGDRVNLERALRIGDRLGGHLVQGHVDGVGEVLEMRPSGEHLRIDIRVPPVVADVSVLHGSITINGVSLTINAVPGPETIQVAIIPHTRRNTTFEDLAPGALVNVEGDLIGRFVARLHERRGGGRAPVVGETPDDE